MKIGIITQYYESYNYGGNLQSYALVKTLNNLSFNAEQISYNYFVPAEFLSFKEKIKKYPFYKVVKKVIKRIINIPKDIYMKSMNKSFVNNINIRRQSFVEFNKSIIMHSATIYDRYLVKESVRSYDVFITGSDQVWNFAWYNPSFFLDFVSSDKKKISYAASISMNSLTVEQKDIFRKHLKDFDAVSVREKSDVELIKDLSPVPVVNTLDPTLLLSREDWDEVCSDRVVDEKYLFSYFLGNNKKERKFAKEFAKRKGLKVVTLPHMCGYQSADKNFGDYQLWDVGPEKFLSLIKHAEYVFTDSFHAVVFSNIYHKQYYVFNRSSKGEMSSRIYNITELFDEQDRYCDTKEKETINYIENLAPINYDREFTKFEEMKEISIDFLKNSLGEPNTNEDEG